MTQETSLQVQWPSDIESRKAISVLNKWIHEIYNNGGVNADFEIRCGKELWYFSYDFARYLNKALKIVENLDLRPHVPEILRYVNWYVNYNATQSILDEEAGSNVYKETDIISNWSDLQIESIDFVKRTANPIFDVIQKLFAESHFER